MKARIGEKTDCLARMREAWDQPPGWIVALAESANRTSIAETARRCNISPSTASQLISNTYPTGNFTLVEAKVRGVLMNETVECPGAGAQIRRDRCEREQATPFAASSPLRVAMWRACRGGCPHSRMTKTEAADV